MATHKARARAATIDGVTYTGIVIAVFVVLAQIVGAILKQRAERAEAERRRQAQTAGAGARPALSPATLDDGTGVGQPATVRPGELAGSSGAGTLGRTRPALSRPAERPAPVRASDAPRPQPATRVRTPPPPPPARPAEPSQKHGGGAAPRARPDKPPRREASIATAAPAGASPRPAQKPAAGHPQPRAIESAFAGTHYDFAQSPIPVTAASIESGAARAMQIKVGRREGDNVRADASLATLHAALHDPRQIRRAILLAEILGPPLAERPSAGGHAGY